MLLSGRAATSGALSTGTGVWLLALAETVSWGLLYYAFGVLLGPMAARSGLPEPRVAVAFSLALVASGLAAPRVGRAVDAWGPGPVMTFGGLLGAAGFVCLAFARHELALYAVWTGLGVAHACTSYEPAFTAVTRWFEQPEARRRALLVLTSVAGFASTVFVPLGSWLVHTRGLQTASLVFAGILAFVVTPLHVAVLRVRHAPRTARDAPPPDHAEAARAGALATLALVFGVHAFASTGATLFLYSSLVARRLEPADAALLAGLVGAAQVPARLLYEPLCRLVPARARLASLLALQATALASWGALAGGPRVAALLVFGAANGLATLERATLVGDWFGSHGYGARSGLLAAATALARAAAPFSVAWMVSRASYAHAFTALAVALAAVMVVAVVGEARRAAGVVPVREPTG